MLTEAQEKFMTRRRRFVRTWPFVGLVLLAALAGVFIYVFVRTPLLANPFYVNDALLDRTLADGQARAMAVFVPILFWMVFLLGVMLILLAFASFANERKWAQIVEALLPKPPGGDGTQPRRPEERESPDTR